MNPSAIKEILSSAKALNQKGRKGSPDAFILSWIAWEGTKFRMLAVGQKLKGIKIKQTYSDHNELELWREKKFRLQWKKVFGKYPDSMPGLPGKIFRQLNNYKKYRDRIIHGKSLGSPSNIQTATDKIIEILENKDWMTDITINSKNKTIRLLEHFERIRKK